MAKSMECQRVQARLTADCRNYVAENVGARYCAVNIRDNNLLRPFKEINMTRTFCSALKRR